MLNLHSGGSNLGFLTQHKKNYIGLQLWCLMPLSTIFQLYHDGQFYWFIGLLNLLWLPPSTQKIPQQIK